MGRRIRRGVRARRVVRRFELWSVAKVALVLHLLCYALSVGVLIGLWWVAYRFGLVKKFETFLSDYGFSDKATRKDFQLKGPPLLRAVAIGGLVLVGINTLLTVVLAFFYNGVSGLFGGLVVSVLEERPRAADATAATPSSSSERPRRGAHERGRRKRRKRERSRSSAVPTPHEKAAQASAHVTPEAAPVDGRPDLDGNWIAAALPDVDEVVTSKSR